MDGITGNLVVTSVGMTEESMEMAVVVDLKYDREIIPNGMQ